MHNKKVLFSLFIPIAMAQLFVPAKMVYEREKILESGKTFKFQLEPIDPSDPFRGKYITLDFANDTANVSVFQALQSNEQIYVKLSENEKGFAVIDTCVKEQPTETPNYVKAEVDYLIDKESNMIRVEYPFNRFYVEESKAAEAEKAYDEARRASTNSTYAVVKVGNGIGIVKNVMVNGMPLEEATEKVKE